MMATGKNLHQFTFFVDIVVDVVVVIVIIYAVVAYSNFIMLFLKLSL